MFEDDDVDVDGDRSHAVIHVQQIIDERDEHDGQQTGGGDPAEHRPSVPGHDPEKSTTEHHHGEQPGHDDHDIHDPLRQCVETAQHLGAKGDERVPEDPFE